MDFSPLIYVKCTIALFIWLVFLALYLKRESIEKVAISLYVQHLTVELLNSESQMKRLPIGVEREVIFNNCINIKEKLRMYSGIVQINENELQSKIKQTDNVVSLHAHKLVNRG